MLSVRTGISTLALGVAMAVSAPAIAQENVDGAAASDDSSGGTIVVTANRREQALEDVAGAIVAISGDELQSEGVTSATDLPNVLPNIQVGVAGFSIRGVASADFTDKGDPSTAFNLNGIYIARFPDQYATMFDVERVEVLRGPQGTLYGRNATAGVVNVISARPRNYFEASGSAEYGNWDTVRLNGMINAPLADGVALRVAGSYNRHDGFTATQDGNDPLDSQDDFAMRVSLSAELGDATDLFVSGDYAWLRNSGAGSIALDRALAQNDDKSLRYQNPGRDTFGRRNTGGVTVELNHGFDFADLTYLFGYRETSASDRASRNDIPAPFVPFTSNGDFLNVGDSNQQSHELRLASNGGGPLEWVVGAYYFKEKVHVQPNLDFVNVGFVLDYDIDTQAESAAVFGQATYELVDGFRVTGGLRYTDDKKRRLGYQDFLQAEGFCSVPGNCRTIFDGTYPGGGISGDKFTWRVGLEADLNPDVLAFANVTTGYKAGGFNDGSPADVSPVPFYYQPETITSYEAGIKGTVLDEALYFALTGFMYDYKDLQLGLVLSTGGQVTRNIPSADIVGLEAEGWLRLGPGTQIDYSLAYLNAEYNDFFPLQSDPTLNFAGTPLDRSPEWSGRIGITQDFELANGGRISGSAALKFSSSYVVTDGNTGAQIAQENYTRTDLTLGYFAPDDAWFIQAFARNLEDNRLLGQFELGAFTLTDPRQYGVRAGFQF
ncbi:conserved hypothetical protein [Altererythrobacter sp. B11]|uniref:TonB-dependent receptor n=1 Tax=Altererythrobacter sp. B11 TaxID=2060312 RepID=UPI000DC70653|nr:TonB-dependent receptor [Altererythrobacter sp. B11]BBC73569.1 conserved hypothetical protein [Altererythrobacter sp. B11]